MGSVAPFKSHTQCSQQKKASIRMPFLIWGERWDLNPRQPEPQSGALPTELRPPRNRISILVSSLLLVNKIWYARQDSAPPAHISLLILRVARLNKLFAFGRPPAASYGVAAPIRRSFPLRARRLPSNPDKVHNLLKIWYARQDSNLLPSA